MYPSAMACSQNEADVTLQDERRENQRVACSAAAITPDTSHRAFDILIVPKILIAEQTSEQRNHNDIWIEIEDRKGLL